MTGQRAILFNFTHNIQIQHQVQVQMPHLHNKLYYLFAHHFKAIFFSLVTFMTMTIILETTMRKFYINHSTTEHTLKCCIKVYKLHSNINCENEITEEISDTFGGMPIEKVAPVDLFTFLLKTTKNA